MEKVPRDHEKDFPRIESRLKAAFRPINPPADFQRDLMQRLVSTPMVKVTMREPLIYQYILVWVAGLVSGVLLLVLGVMAIKAIVSRYRLNVPQQLA
jgi:hypothetical protein